jgi:hypothetical protein
MHIYPFFRHPSNPSPLMQAQCSSMQILDRYTTIPVYFLSCLLSFPVYVYFHIFSTIPFFRLLPFHELFLFSLFCLLPFPAYFLFLSDFFPVYFLFLSTSICSQQFSFFCLLPFLSTFFSCFIPFPVDVLSLSTSIYSRLILTSFLPTSSYKV